MQALLITEKEAVFVVFDPAPPEMTFCKMTFSEVNE